MTLKYDVIHSDRQTIRITIDRDRRIIVRAPERARPEAISAIVESKRFWIWEKLRDPRKYGNVLTGKEFVAGESFLFLGQDYSLTLIDAPRGDVSLNGRCFELSRSDRNSGRELFRNWFKRQAKEHLRPRVAALAHRMGVEFSRVAVRDLRYSWGSCTRGGTLTFNWRIVQAPSPVIDYLVVHELAHVLEPSHSKEYWNIVAVHAPSWMKAREWLRLHGARLEW